MSTLQTGYPRVHGSTASPVDSVHSSSPLSVLGGVNAGKSSNSRHVSGNPKAVMRSSRALGKLTRAPAAPTWADAAKTPEAPEISGTRGEFYFVSDSDKALFKEQG